MKIVHEGKFEILTPNLLSQLLIIEKAGRTCYQSEKGPITLESATSFAKKLIKAGHESVIEHSILTVKFTDVSRGFTHEVVRHRIASFSQESTRYVDYDDEMTFVLPKHKNMCQLVFYSFNPLDETGGSAGSYMRNIEQYYRHLRDAGWLPEDARQVLPIALCSDIVVTANWREWRHIFEMRCAKSAHWEIRQVMGKLLAHLQSVLPGIFDDFVLMGQDKNGYDYWKKVT